MEENENLNHSLDVILRPTTWEEYTGQEGVKKNLSILIDAARERGQMPEHILLHGPGGLGKTTLAHIIGNLLNVPVREINGTMIDRAGDIVSLASTLEAGGVLFIDEIHRLKGNIEETLYPIMETGSISVMVGKGPTARSVKINLPPITIIAATTQVGALSSPLRSRFSGGVHRLQEYTPEELANIIERSAKTLKVPITREAALAIAQRARQTPRIGNSLLKRVRDYAQIHQKEMTPDLVNEALGDIDIDEYGLTVEDRTLLFTLRDVFNGGPVGIQALATALNETVQTIEEVYEPFLLHTGFISRTLRGRVLTEKGQGYLSSIEEMNN